jgi:nitroimidazol reductase NimA-like FMN-containing flavoprotein (pyridoxamine 5'-phosphate oxidase superfamily)
MSHNSEKMRLGDREITSFDEIIAVLDKCAVIRLAMLAGRADAVEPYIVPVSFGYRVDGGESQKSLALFFHSAKEGKKVVALNKNPLVCFEADMDVRLIKAKDACMWSTAYKSVIGYGKAHALTASEEKRAALDEIMKHMGFEGAPVYQDASLERVLLFRIDVTRITGKKRCL